MAQIENEIRFDNVPIHRIIFKTRKNDVAKEMSIKIYIAQQGPFKANEISYE